MGTATNSPPTMALETTLCLKRIGWLYPFFATLHLYHGLLGDARGEHGIAQRKARLAAR